MMNGTEIRFLLSCWDSSNSIEYQVPSTQYLVPSTEKRDRDSLPAFPPYRPT